MKQIPRDKNPDSTLALAFDGYEFISKRCDRQNSDIFQTNLLFQKTICMRGEKSARLFYDTDRFKRQGAVPAYIQTTLFGSDGVQGLDGKAHYHRKKLFMFLMKPENFQDLIDLASEQWRDYAQKWEQQDNIVLFYEVQELLCKAVCNWLEISIQGSELRLRTNDFAAMIDGAGSVGLRHLKARQARNRTEEWAKKLIDQVRRRYIKGSKENIIYRLANYSDEEGDRLDLHTAAVELINILRPTVAVARYIIFSALALYRYPQFNAYSGPDDKESLTFFVQEVRRYYPFFPFVAALVRKDFNWKGYHFPEGTSVLLDLYGTNHDPKLWEKPDVFNPDRFRNRDDDPYSFIPQGGGNHDINHRCPGEWITIALMKNAIQFLNNEITYDVPDQNLNIPLSRIPAIPESRFIIKNVRIR